MRDTRKSRVRTRAFLPFVILVLAACSQAAPPASTGPVRLAASQPVTAAVTNPPTSPPATTSPPAPTPEPTPTIIDGTWEVTTTEAELVAASPVPGEDNQGNYGHFTLVLHAGSYVLTQTTPGGGSGAGIYVINDHKFVMRTDIGEEFAYPFTVTKTTLTFGLGGPVTMRIKPWTRVGP